MTLNELRQFLVLAEYKSFSKAAETLFISQQALSKNISKLEQELGFALVIRSYHHLKLSEEGMAVYAFLSKSAAGFKELIASLRPHNEIPMQILNIGYAELLDMSLFMSEHIRMVSQDKALPMLTVERIQTSQVSEKLLNNEMDLCFCYPDFERSAQIASFVVKTAEIYLCISKNNPRTANAQGIQDFLGEIVYEAAGYQKLNLHRQSGKFRHVLESVMEREQITNQTIRVQEVPTLESVLTAVETGCGIAVLPESNPLTQSNLIRTYPIGVQGYIHCVYNKDNKNPFVIDFVEHLRKQCQL